MAEFDGSEIWKQERRKEELNKPGAMLFNRVERKQRIQLEDSTGFEELQTQFDSDENKTIFNQPKTVRQQVSDYKGLGPGRIIIQNNNAGDGIFFYPDDPDFDKKAVESVAGWGRAFNAPAEFAPLLSVAAKLPTLARQRSLNRAKTTFMKVDESLNIADSFNVTPYQSLFTGKTNKLLNPQKIEQKPTTTTNNFNNFNSFVVKAERTQPVNRGLSTAEILNQQGLVHNIFTENSATLNTFNNLGDPLTKSVQPVSEILPHKSIREAGGVSLYNPDQAGAIQQLITQKIHTAMDAGPKFVTEMFEEIWPNVDTSTLTTQQMKKKLTIALGSKTKAGGPVATSNLDRGLAEILLGDNKFLHGIGVIDEVVNNPSVLDPKNISKWLGAIDSRVSSTTDGVALHHATLTSSKPVLDNATAQWGKRFLNLMREKVIPGAEGIVKQDALAHKPFSSPKIKNKSGKLVADNTKWVVKGVLADVLKKYTDLPKSATGDILMNKEVSKIGDWSKGLEGQLQKLIRSINDKAAHAPWSHGTTGWTLDSRLAQYSPEDAFSVAEYIFDLERAVSMQGIRVTQTLNKWKKTISKGDFGQPPNLEKAVADLQRKIDNIRIDKSRIKSMEEAYKIRLDILLEKGPEALREFNAKALQGPNPAPDLVQSMNK